MAAVDADGVFQHGINVLGSTISEKTHRILLQTGNVGLKSTGEDGVEGSESTVHADNVEHIQTVGFVSRPSNADPGKAAATATIIRDGAHDIAIGLQDERGLELAGKLKPGEACVYAGGGDGKGQARGLWKADGSINFFTTEGNVEGGKGNIFSLKADGSITAATSKGCALLLGSDEAVDLFNKSGSFGISASGDVSITGKSKLSMSAGSVTIGSPSALPIAIGPNVVTAVSALQAQLTAAQAEITALKAELTVMATAWAALGALAGPILGAMVAPIAAPVAGAEVAALAAITTGATSIGTGTATVSTATAIIPSKRTSSD